MYKNYNMTQLTLPMDKNIKMVVSTIFHVETTIFLVN